MFCNRFSVSPLRIFIHRDIVNLLIFKDGRTYHFGQKNVDKYGERLWNSLFRVKYSSLSFIQPMLHNFMTKKIKLKLPKLQVQKQYFIQLQQAIRNKFNFNTKINLFMTCISVSLMLFINVYSKTHWI